MNSDKLKSIISKKTLGDSVNSLTLFQMFYFERLLERVSLSKYKNKIILKGGLLLSSIFGDNERTTKDMDATLKGIPLTEEKVRKIFEEIINIDLEDGVVFEIINIKDIRLESVYGGFKINFLGKMDKNKTFIAVELTTGDEITPRETKYGYKCMFENKTIPIMAYTLETIIAEKFQTVIYRGVVNTRLKDFYDIYVLMELKKDEIDIETLKLAINRTFLKRQTIFDINEFYNIVKSLKEDERLNSLWREYQRKNSYVKNVSFNSTIIAIEKIISILDGSKVSI